MLHADANPSTKDWWERYLKHTISFRGVKMSDIRRALRTWLREEAITTHLPPPIQVDTALQLLRQKHAEDKLAGILMLQETLIPNGAVDWRRDLPRLAALFEDGYIYDWNTCDWLCIKALGPLAHREGEPCARAIAEWCHACNLWQRRASGVAFVNLAKHGDANFTGFVDMLLDTCAVTVRSPDRFVQTGTGWVLRELYLAEQTQVIRFTERHAALFSSEGMRYATEKMPKGISARLRKLRRVAVRNAASE